MSDVPHLVPVRRTATLAAVVGLALATAGCGTEAGQPAGQPAAGQPATVDASPEPVAAASGGPAELPTFDPSSAVATYAEGFPPDLFPLPEGATLLASSARPATSGTPSGGAGDGKGGGKGSGTPMTQVTLNLSSQLPAKKVIGQAREILLAQGFRQVSAPESSGLTAQTAFLRISRTKAGEVQESLVVGVLDDGDRRLASISGTVRTP
nr:hypothetical protein GCM10025730_50600 [Promicromonospora thailandica]